MNEKLNICHAEINSKSSFGITVRRLFFRVQCCYIHTFHQMEGFIITKSMPFPLYIQHHHHSYHWHPLSSIHYSHSDQTSAQKRADSLFLSCHFLNRLQFHSISKHFISTGAAPLTKKYLQQVKKKSQNYMTAYFQFKLHYFF